MNEVELLFSMKRSMKEVIKNMVVVGLDPSTKIKQLVDAGSSVWGRTIDHKTVATWIKEVQQEIADQQ